MGGRIIIGIVIDNEGEFFIGVNVYVKKMIKGIVMDFNGVYELLIVEDVEVFVFFYVGFSIKEVVIEDGRDIYDVELSF